MHFRRSDSDDPYAEAMRELNAYGGSPDRLPGLSPGEPNRRSYPYPRGFYGELNWEWDGAQRGPFSGRGPKGYRRSDERIREDASEALYRAGDLDASDVTVEVKDAEVILEGTVGDRRAKRLAEDLVGGLPGVRDVHNRLRLPR